MKYLKLYENYTINNIDDIIDKTNELLLNKKIVNQLKNILNQLPSNIKKHMINYIINDGINLDKINNYINKYNLIDKIKKYLDKGYDIQKITKLLIPVTESVSAIFGIIALGIVGVLLILLTAFLPYVNNKLILSLILFLGVSIIGFFVSNTTENKIRLNTIEQHDNRVRFQIDNKDDVIVIYLNNKKDSIEIYQNTKERTYYIKKNDSEYKSYYHTKFE
jgi:hypothetical protein